MIGWCLASAVAALLFAITAPALGRRLSPRVAARLLVACVLVVAPSTICVLAALAAVWLGQVPAVAGYGDWSAEAMRSGDPVPGLIGVTSVVLLLATLVVTVVAAARRVRAMWRMHRVCRAHPRREGLVVLDSDQADAFATPLGGGRIVVTTGLLRALGPDERRALVAHERAHLAQRHAWLVLAADLAAAANPLLAPTARAVGHAVERWADEDAAAEVGDRRLVARAVARAALHRRRVGAALAAVDGRVPDRVRALLTPPPRSRSVLPAAALLALLAVSAVTALAVGEDSDDRFDSARINPARADTRTSEEHELIDIASQVIQYRYATRT